MAQELAEAEVPEGPGDATADRCLHELEVGGLNMELGGMELGGNVWMLDRDQNGPWKIVQKKTSKKTNIKTSNRFTPQQEVAEEDMDFRWPGADAE